MTTSNEPAESGETGTPDVAYDLISVLYHSLESAETCQRYLSDAQRAEEDELADFFRQAVDQNRALAEQAKTLLAARMGTAQTPEAEAEPEPEPESNIEEEAGEPFHGNAAPPY
jgi:hypothetical protein